MRLDFPIYSTMVPSNGWIFRDHFPSRLNTMKRIRLSVHAWTILVLAPLPSIAQEEPDFQPLFNGSDLTGWVNVNCAPETWSIREGVIHCTGRPIGALRTDRQFENFILELEWRHLRAGGNAGVFIWASPIAATGQPFLRAIEVQVLDHGYGKSDWFTTHGDVFPIHGSTMRPHGRHNGMRSFPSEERSKGSPEWNHYRIDCRDGVLRLHVNGKEVSGGSECNWRKGYLALESEGSPVEFRNIRIQEFPSTGAGPEESAPESLGFLPLYNGVDLRGWNLPSGSEDHWQPADWVLRYDGASTANVKDLWTEASYRDFELIVDWRLPKEVRRPDHEIPKLLPDGTHAAGDDGAELTETIADHGDSGIYLRGSTKAQVNIWSWPAGSGEIWGYRTDPALDPALRPQLVPAKRADRPFGEWNRFHITLRGNTLEVSLNDIQVIAPVELPELSAEGPIGLQHHGDPVEFANLYIRPLP